MAKYMFKPGDRVRIRTLEDFKKNFKTNDIGSFVCGTDTFCDGMHHLCGRTATIESIGQCKNDRVELVFDNTSGDTVWNYTVSMIEPANKDKIVIYIDGNKTIAKNTTTGKTAEAVCSPDDTFDFAIGAKLALDRLLTPDPPKKQYFNGRVVCVATDYDWWTVGKIYDVVDGIIVADDGDKYPKQGPSFDPKEREPYIDAYDILHAGCSRCTKHNERNTFVALKE